MPTHYTIVRICTLLFLSGIANWTIAQCNLVFNQDIPDNGQISFVLEVNDLVVEDLGAGQGLCGVKLNFRHSYVGDLTIELTSPAGQTLQLVGPVTDQINPTNLTTWDINFQPCGTTVSPDAGFSDTWDNNQGWGVFGSFIGTYYPSSGCLEDYDTGSANGKWILTLTDADPTATGILMSVELIFCDNTGLTCIVCDADAGEFDLVDFQICEGESIHDSTFISDFPQGAPDSDIYNYAYLVSANDISFKAQSALSGTGWPVGSYTICGMSYAKVDSSKLFDQLDTMTFVEIQMAFDGDAIDNCAELTRPCIRFHVNEIPDTVQLIESICIGSSFQVGGNSFSQPGDYVIDLVTEGGCDSIVHLNLDIIQVSAVITQLDTLTCEEQSTLLSAASSTVPGLPRYEWATVGGIMIGPTNQFALVIASPGVYTVTVTDVQSGCTSTKSWNAISDGSEPFLLVPDGSISCSDTAFTFEPIAFPQDVIYDWFGPGGFTDTVENPSVTEGGIYTLKVTDEDGCVAIVQAEVSYDTTVILNTSFRVWKDCIQSVTRIVADPGGGTAYSWTGPGGFTSSNRIVTTPVPGTYFVGIRQSNGCVGSDSITVTHDYTVPDVNMTAAKDSISCGETVLLSASSSLNQTTFNWSGSGVNISDTNQVIATGPGDYSVVGVAPNLCKASDNVTIHQGLDLADVLTFTDTITCDEDTVSIGVISLGNVIRYQWTGPGMVDSTTSFIKVTEGGTYQVVMTDFFGCVQQVSIVVVTNTSVINFWFLSDTNTCSQTVSELTFAANRPIRHFEWLMPDGQILTDSIISAETGDLYTLTLIGDNGCSRLRRFRVPVDTIKPLIFIEPAAYGCYDSIQIFSYLPDSVIGQQWTGPNGFVSDNPNPFIHGAGIYSLTATGLNGCSDTEDIEVTPDDAIPLIMTSSELLDCIDSSAIIQTSSPDDSVTFEWFLQGLRVGDSTVLTVYGPGQYIVVATAENNCQISDTIEIYPPVIPVVYAVPDTLNCRDSSIELNALSDSTNMIFNWYDAQGNDIGIGQTITLNTPGIYNLRGEWTNGCTFDTTVTVFSDTMQPLAVASTKEVIKCLVQDIYLSADASIGDSLMYQWSTPDGDILIGGTSDSAYIHGAGLYILRVEEFLNHCASRDTLVITELPNTLESLELTIVPECQGNLAGAIIFDNVIDAGAGLMYSIGLNGGSANPVFDSLARGDYLVSAADSFGCSVDSLITITETSSKTVDLGPDFEILIGDTATLVAKLNIDSSALSSISWDPKLPCDSCLSNIVYLTETQSFTINIRDAAGCLASNKVTVFVQDKGRVFVPNVFSPNNDGINDLLTLNAHTGVAFVKQFRIMDRWGNQVFGVENIDPHNQQIAWDGKFGGNDMNPAVYAYILEVELITGRIEIHSGDITLLR